MRDRGRESNERRDREARRRRALGQTMTAEGWMDRADLERRQRELDEELAALLSDLDFDQNGGEQ